MKDDFVRSLAVRAATIDEILSADFETLPGQKAEIEKAALRLSAWCRSAADGDWDMFARRLSRDDYSFEFVLSRFAGARLRDSVEIPKWIEDAKWIYTIAKDSITFQSSYDPSLTPSFPFEEIIAPFVRHTANKLWSAQSHTTKKLLLPSAVNCLENELIGRLSGLCGTHFYRIFDHFRSVIHTDPFSTDTTGSPPNPIYQNFLKLMCSGELVVLFDEKPVLLRLFALITRQWLDSTNELIARLSDDLPEIRAAFLNSQDQNIIEEIHGGLSDLHHNGRAVKILQFSCGSRVVYKPKDLEIESEWYSLIDNLNSRKPPTNLRSAFVLPMNGYGWAEYIPHQGLINEDSSKSFFRRAGAWLALFHIFCGADMHDENFIACADHPIPIDLEMLLQPENTEYWRRDEYTSAHEAAIWKIQNSVAFIGMLPSLARLQNQGVMRFGGLEAKVTTATALKWLDLNTDNMRPQRSKVCLGVQTNMPHLNGRYMRFDAFVEDFVEGFIDYACFLLHMRDNDSSFAESIFSSFSGLETRKIIHPTRFYNLLLTRMRAHKRMDDGVIWSAEADFVSRLADWDQEVDITWPLRKDERADLLNLDIPHFTMRTDLTDIIYNGKKVGELCEAPGLIRAKDRFMGLNYLELDWQVAVIRQSSASTLQAGSFDKAKAAFPRALPEFNGRVLSVNESLEEATKLFSSIKDLAFLRYAGAAWVGLDWVGDSEICRLGALGPDLYNGTGGVSIFCAALGKATESRCATDLAVSCLAGARKSLRDVTAARTVRGIGIGGGVGFGSVIYTLCVVSRLTGREDLLAEAQIAARLFSNDLIAGDNVFDVLEGSAGAILCLLRLYREVKLDHVLDCAVRCGRHMLQQPRIGTVGRRCWPNPDLQSMALTGMSHGSAGFALALGSLFAMTGQIEFRDAAVECISYERSVYDNSKQNWPDLRKPERPMWLSQWCHGAVGIGLSRIGLLGIPSFSGLELERDVKRACRADDLCWPQRSDTLCCGTLGSIELLREAGKMLGKEDLSALAENRLARIVKAAEKEGDYKWQIGQKQFNVGLFRGLSGVGYTILRGIDDSLPNVLIWE